MGLFGPRCVGYNSIMFSNQGIDAFVKILSAATYATDVNSELSEGVRNAFVALREELEVHNEHELAALVELAHGQVVLPEEDAWEKSREDREVHNERVIRAARAIDTEIADAQEDETGFSFGRWCRNSSWLGSRKDT